MLRREYYARIERRNRRMRVALAFQTLVIATLAVLLLGIELRLKGVL